MGGSYHAGEERGEETRVMTPSGLWQERGRLTMKGPSTPPPLPCSAALFAAQTSEHISHILAFDSLEAWFVASIGGGGAQGPCLTGSFPFERASLWTDLVPLKGLRPPLCSLNQQRAPLSPLHERAWLGKQYTKYAFSLLHDSPVSWPLSPFEYPSFLPFYHLRLLLLSCHMLIPAAIAKG